ncbi:MAG: serine/threonine-protein kinase [Nannocystaceae bacterium]
MVIGERYEIISKIGEGGMGQVFRATQRNLRREVALKLLDPSAVDMESGQRRFLREARVAAALRHPNAVEIYDVGTDGVHVYIAMELLHGDVLRDVIEHRGRLPLPEAIELTIQIADLLVAAHAMSLVHRDLKPENIFVDRDREGGQRARVVDFGLAFIEGDEETGRLTREGLVVGTPAFLSPEQAQGGTVGPPSDIYSLGCVLYEMLSGQTVFRGSHMNILTQHIYVAPVPLRERVPDAGVPADLDDLVMRMLGKRAVDRPSAQAVIDALHLVQGTLAGQRHRGRDDRLLATRSSRMISVPAHRPPVIDQDAVERAAPELEGFQVGVLGEFPDELWFGMASNGLYAERLELGDDPRGVLCDALLIADEHLDVVPSLVRSGVPVVVVTPASRVEQLAELLRLGVKEVLSPPLEPDVVARKIRRAVERNRRHSSRRRR